MTRRRVTTALALGLGVVLAVPQAVAALLVYTLVVTPLVVTGGQLTTFTLTATNGDLLTELGCLEVVLPVSFQNVSASDASASNGDDWTAAATGSTVVVHSLSGGGRLEFLQTVTFTIIARATVAGVTTWANHAHRPQDCSGTDQPGMPLAVTVLLPVPTPKPLPTPAPTPEPTPAPTASPRPMPTVPVPTPSASLPLPSLPLPSLPLPSLPLPSSSANPSASSAPGPTASPRSSASPTPRPSGGSPNPSESAVAAPSSGSASGGPPSPSSGGSPGPGSGDPESRLPSVRFDEQRLDLGGASVALFAGVEIWAVPAATIALPGLLVLIWVALQAAGAIAWIPAVRRLQGKDDPRRRTRVRTQ